MDPAVTCCFSGHRPARLPWGRNEADPRCLALKARLDQALEEAHRQGFRHFLCGMAQRRRMTLLDQCDLETVVQHTYTPGCMNRRNRYMVDRSSLLIAVYDGIPQGGTLNTLSYAMGKGVRTVILPVVSPAQ